MAGIPALPQEISPDGREVWDWAHKLSERVQTVAEYKKVRASLEVLGERCGDCTKWMCSSICPRERNVNGMSQGPSADAKRCADAFVAKSDVAQRRELLTTKLAELTAALSPAQSNPPQENRRDD